MPETSVKGEVFKEAQMHPHTRSRAPLRLGLAGGGTDLSPYCDMFGGAVLNATIDRYAFASIALRSDQKIEFRARDLGVCEIFHSLEDISNSQLPLHRGVYLTMLEQYGSGEPIYATVTTTVDAQAGSGLGSSSALTVALVDAFRMLLSAPLGQYDVARLAFEIERVRLGLSGGRQDQYAAAFGGVNFIEFLPSDKVIVNPLRVPDYVLNELESSLVTCFSGRSRSSSEIIDRQKLGLKEGNKKTTEAMHQLKMDAIEMKAALLRGDIYGLADILNQSWNAKRATAHGVSTDRIDDLFQVAMRHGALAGKVSGAGGGGFMFFLVPPEQRFDLIEALTSSGGAASPVKFTARGCESWQMTKMNMAA